MNALVRTLLCCVLLASCSAPSPTPRVCHHFGGMEVQACEYRAAELAGLSDNQGVMLLGWLQEDGETLYIVDDDDGTRIRVDAVRYEGFDEFRTRLIDRYVRATGMYLPQSGGLELVSIRYRPEPD